MKGVIALHLTAF